MRVVIVGGTGLIGSALSEKLAAEDESHEIIILSRTPEKATDLPAGARAVHWDALTTDGWASTVDGADAVVNLAGETTLAIWTEKHKERIRESRLNVGHALVEAVERARIKPRVLIQASGVDYYGYTGDQTITEDDPPGESFLAHVAVDWEDATEVVEQMGVRRVILRSGLVLSRDGGALPLMLLPFRLYLGGVLGSGAQWFPWIHIVDQTRAIRFLIEEKSAHGPYNLTTPNPVTHAEMMHAIGRALRRPTWLHVPAFAVRLALGQMSRLLLYGQRAVPRRLQDAGFAFRFPTADAALRDLTS
jgi:uncharacterized protein (TIGR01777 family)